MEVYGSWDCFTCMNKFFKTKESAIIHCCKSYLNNVGKLGLTKEGLVDCFIDLTENGIYPKESEDSPMFEVFAEPVYD